MDRKEIVEILEQIAVLLELSGENPFKARSYTNVARQIEQSEEDLGTLVREKRLREIKGVGEALEQKIEELVTTGRLGYYEELRAKFPESLFELFSIPGLGAKRIRALYDDLGISSLGELEYACNENRLTGLKGFGPRMQEKIVQGIEFAKKHRDRVLFSRARQEADRLVEHLRQEAGVIRIEVAGSLRRKRETVKDIDILVSSENPDSVMERFVTAPNVETVTSRGETKSSVILKSGLPADLRVVEDSQFPCALHHFTGSKEHNVAMRQRARERGLKMNEYGVFRGADVIPCPDEAALFAVMELPFIAPELREDMGELAGDHLPRLVERSDLIGMFHCHSTYSDGSATIRQMAEGAKERGYQYLTVTDHSQSAHYAGGLTPERVAQQAEEIDRLNAKMVAFQILKGIESDILRDGSLDYEQGVLRTFDLVIASVHNKLDMAEEEATRRIVRAIENPATTILGHPTGRLLLSREGYPLDFEKVFDACLANRVAIEINANAHRLDLDWRHIKRAKEKGIKLVLGPDAHNVESLDDMDYGLGIARKGWLERGDLLNCMTVTEFMEWRNAK